MKTNLESVVVSTIASPDLQDGIADLAEVGLDQLLTDGVLNDVPVVGTLAKAIRTAGRVRDALLVRKLAKFFQALSKVSLDERQAFYTSLGSESDRRRVGEALLLLLERLDDMAKPELVARVFRALIRREIDRAQFDRMASAIDRIHLSRLPTLLQFYAQPDQQFDTGSEDAEAYQELAFVGLVRLSVRISSGMFDPAMAGGSATYVQNQLGTLLAGILTRDV
jgi:hypothetical protein